MENQKTKNEFTTSSLNDYKIIRKAYIDFFEKNYQMIDTKLYDILLYNIFRLIIIEFQDLQSF